MKRKKKGQWKSWIIVGGCGGLCLLLAGLTFPKVGELGRLKKEWAEIAPLAEQGKNLQNEEKPKVPTFGPDNDPRKQLPERDESLEFLNKLLSAGLDAGVGKIPYYQLDKVSYWPTTLPEGANPDEKPADYSELNRTEASGIRRHVVHLQFQAPYKALFSFYEKMEKIPQFSQVYLTKMTSNGDIVDVEMHVETFSMAVTR